jgi:hypothetical protein
VTTETGIRRLVPAADIDDYVFEPCGYSMNGILGGGFITIHITPEQVRPHWVLFGWVRRGQGEPERQSVDWGHCQPHDTQAGATLVLRALVACATSSQLQSAVWHPHAP